MLHDSSNQLLALQIQQLVREHLINSKAAVLSAVEAAFMPTEPAVTRPTGRTQRKKPATPPTKRRTTEEIAELGERFYAVVCEYAGEPMAILAPLVGVSSRELELPVARLKQDGRVRSVGQRSETKYFPLIGKSAAHSAVKQ